MLNEVGTKKALTQGQTIVFHRRRQDLEFLIYLWSIENHMLVVREGEFSPSLEDVSALTSLPMYGNTHTIDTVLNSRDQEI